MSGRPPESGWLIPLVFSEQGWSRLFFFFLQDSLWWYWERCYMLSGELAISIRSGKDTCYSWKHTAVLQRTQCWISSNRALHVFNWKLQRSDFEWINAWINSECSSFPRHAQLSLSVQWPFIKWNLITIFRPYQQQEGQEINCLENISQLCRAEYNLIAL